MTEKLTDKDMDQLEQWIATGPKTFTLLYAITRDGCNSTTFHQKCDNQGATVTVLYNPQGSVYGGYTGGNWANTGKFVNDATAFLYRLHYNKVVDPVKLPITNAACAIFTGYGPTFGGSSTHDLFTFNGTVNNSGSYFALNGSMALGYNYDNQGLNANQINNGTMNVTELEVYKVETGERQKPPNDKEPWRQTKSWNEQFLKEITEGIVAFKPVSGLEVSEARILIIGPVGAGKSSFYNTINSIFRGRITQTACSGSAEQSLTTAYTPYKVKVISGSPLNFRLCDTRGLEESQGLGVLECNYLLDGNIPNYYQFNPTSVINPKTPGFKVSPTANDVIHCAVFVLDATTLEVISSKIIENMKSFQDLMNQKGIPQTILLTKVDKLCKYVQKDVSLVFKSPEVEKHVEKASHLLGLPRANILPVKNYENEQYLDDNISILALLALRKILYFAEDFLDHMLDKLQDAKSEESK